jgi:hypothetical protein
MQTMEQMRLMTANDLAMFGVQDIAYVKPVVVDGNAGYAIHAADGTQMAVIADRDHRLRRGAPERAGAGQRSLTGTAVRGHDAARTRDEGSVPGQQRVERVGIVGAAQFLAGRARRAAGARRGRAP